MRRRNLRARDCATFAFLLVFASLIFAFYINRPHHNHDLAGYVGSVISFREPNPVEIHRKTFETLRSQTPEHRFIRLSGQGVDSAEAVRILGADPDSFAQTLRFYQVRIGYTGIINLFHICGFELVFATHLVSALSVFFTILLLGFLFPGQRPFPYQILIPLFFIGSGGHDLARLSTPDALGMLCWTLAFSLFFRRHVAFLVLLPLTVLIRNDYILMVILLCPFIIYLKTFPLPLVLASLSFSFILQAAVNSYYDSFGVIEVLNYLKHMEYLPFPVSEGIDVTIFDYLGLLSGAVASTLDPSQNTLHFYLATVCLVAYFSGCRFPPPKVPSTGRETEILAVATAGFLYIVAHIFVFPFFLDRYFSFLYMVTACSMAHLAFLKHPQDSCDEIDSDLDDLRSGNSASSDRI